MKQEQDTKTDQNHGSGGHAFGEALAVSRTEHRSQAEWIGRGPPFLNSFGRLDRVDELIKIKRSDTKTENGSHGVAGGVIGADYQQHENDEVRESLGVLAVIDGAHAKREKS